MHFAMSTSGSGEDNYLMISDNRLLGSDLVTTINSHAPELDEGFCFFNLSPKSAINKSNCNISKCLDTNVLVPPPNTMRRVKSTPNLLQIPSPQRSRKRSDDSAVGSGSESSDKLSDISTGECNQFKHSSRLHDIYSFKIHFKICLGKFILFLFLFNWTYLLAIKLNG